MRRASRIPNSARTPLPALVVAGLALLFTQSPAAHAWGNGGHRLINKLAASTLPVSVPEFLRSEAAINEIEYLGPEPDRWRSPAEPELNAAQAPEHFIDLEPADALGPLPRRRLDFEAKVFAAGERPEKIGLQPWEATEVWERLKAALREYRALQAAHQDTRGVEAAALFYAGWLGHYVGDASQPLHTTIQYNGWVGPNPNGYTTEHRIHWQFEGPFVDANLHEPEVRAKMTEVEGHWGRHLLTLCGVPARDQDATSRGCINWRRQAGLWARERRSRGSLRRSGWPRERRCCAT